MLEAKIEDDSYFDVLVIKNCVRSQIAVTTRLVSSNFKLIVCKNSYLNPLWHTEAAGHNKLM